jgi:hypothetical protein
MSENVGASIPCKTKDVHGTYRDNFNFTYELASNPARKGFNEGTL